MLPELLLQERINRISKRIAALQVRHRQISNLRIAIFIIGATAVWLSFRQHAAYGMFALMAFWAIFMFVARKHRALEAGLDRFKRMVALKQDRIHRIHLDWEHIPLAPLPQAIEGLARDLNLLGERSIWALLNTTSSKAAGHLLAQWLTQTNPLTESQKRQAYVRELVNMERFRDRLRLIGFSKADLPAFNVHFKPQNEVNLQQWLIGLTVFALLNGLIWLFTPTLVALTVFIYWVLYIGQLKRFKDVFDDALDTHDLLERISPPLLFLEQAKIPRTAALHELLQPVRTPQSRPSQYLRRIQRIGTAVAYTRNEFLFVLLNTLVPYQLICGWLLYREKQKLTHLMPEWLQVWYEVEALCSLATYAADRPETQFPILLAKTPAQPTVLLQAQAVGHPLIPNKNKVRNSFSFKELGEIGLITGSNMSGKSTFLRTLGANLCLAYAGTTVDAKTFSTIVFRLETCLNVSDSVNDGISYFYAEVKRLKALLDATEAPHEAPVLFLIDEIFRGTNNRERLLGSQSYVKALATKPALGLISTHDLELVQLASEMPKLQNYHFREEVQQGQMTFDYQLRSGPCPTTNALKIMALEGLPIAFTSSTA